MMIKTLMDLNDEKSRKVKSNGWYRIPSDFGLVWFFYKDGVHTQTVMGSPTIAGATLFSGFVGDDESGDSEDIFVGSKNWSNAERSLEKWIEQHPKGWF